MILPNIKAITRKRLTQLTKNRIGQNYREWRDKVLARDGFVCQFPRCNKKEKLEVHHIKKWSKHRHLRTELYNGVTLCDKCHDKISGQEQRWEDYFFKIVIANGKRLKNKDNS